MIKNLKIKIIKFDLKNNEMKTDFRAKKESAWVISNPECGAVNFNFKF